MRVELIKTNQERLAKKDQFETELFQKDMERMERRIEVKSAKEQLEEDLTDYRASLD